MAKKKPSALSKLNNLDSKNTTDRKCETVQGDPVLCEIALSQNPKPPSLKNAQRGTHKTGISDLFHKDKLSPVSYVAMEGSSQDQNTDAPIENIAAQSNFDYTDFEKQLDADDIIRARKRIRQKKRARDIHRLLTVSLISGCLYLIFLIYGAWNTQYIYNDDGIVVAQRLTAEQIGNLADFDGIATLYRQARMIYEDVLLLDYRIAAGMEDTLLIAPEYEKELEIIEQVAIQCQGMSVPAEYAQLHTMLTAWVANDIAVYCQRMSSAISQNNSTYAEQALEYKQICYNDFSIITENLSTVGQTVYGADISDIKEWSPESYINNVIGVLGGEVIG